MPAETQARMSCNVTRAARRPRGFFFSLEAAGVALDQEAQGVPKCTYQSCLRRIRWRTWRSVFGLWTSR
eukprot:4268171-Heterocapsa_arctica.AAC.1